MKIDYEQNKELIQSAIDRFLSDSLHQAVIYQINGWDYKGKIEKQAKILVEQRIRPLLEKKIEECKYINEMIDEILKSKVERLASKLIKNKTEA